MGITMMKTVVCWYACCKCSSRPLHLFRIWIKQRMQLIFIKLVSLLLLPVEEQKFLIWAKQKLPSHILENWLFSFSTNTFYVKKMLQPFTVVPSTSWHTNKIDHSKFLGYIYLHLDCRMNEYLLSPSPMRFYSFCFCHSV